MTKTRFDLEDEIMKCWHITDDLDTVSDLVLDTNMDAEDMDKLLNALIGMKTIYDKKFQKLFDTMETLIREGAIQ